MTTKINLNNLIDSDYKALLQNDKVTEKLIEYTGETASDVVNEWLNGLDGVRDYSLSNSYEHNYMYVSNSYKFLDSVLTAQSDYGLLSDVLTEKVEKLLSNYENSDLSSDYEDTLDMVSEQVAGELVAYAAADYDYYMSESYLLEAMKECEVLIDLYGNDAYYNREENKIYYVVAD